MNYSIQEIQKIINGNFLQENNDARIMLVAIDTRHVSQVENNLFFCLIARNNGHIFIERAYKKGIRNFVVSEQMDCKNFSTANFILVENTTIALQTLAVYHRSQFQIPVIGITGSNGKTIVKEWLFQLLSKEKNIVKSPKSYNSQIGVPLSVLNMGKEHELAIFEAGISTTDEMAVLQKIIQPTIGILTNIGTAHDAGFSSTAEKTEEKLKLFSGSIALIYGEKYIDSFSENSSSQLCFSFGSTSTATIQCIELEQKNNHTFFQISASNNSNIHGSIAIPFLDEASIENCLTCVTTLIYLGYSIETIQQKIQALRNLPMRLELKYGIHNCTLIDDSYSADFHSLQIALDFLQQQSSHKKKTIIISDFEDSGLSEKDFIQKLKSILQQQKFDKLIGVGKAFMHHIESLAYTVKEWYVFENTEKLIQQFHVLHFENEIILLKGARAFTFEKITAQLVGQTHATVLEVNLNALTNNLNIYKQILPKNVGIIAMVKAFSYGSGSVEVASLLEKQGVAYLAVAYADEGVELRKNNIKLPIMVMNPDVVDFDRMLEFSLEPEIYALSILQHLINKIDGNNIAIHIKLETGMNRLGFAIAEINELITVLQQHPNITVKTIFSHLAASEDAQLDAFTLQQIQTFEVGSTQLMAVFDYPIQRHIVNSSGIVRFPQAHFDFVRLGIGLYGVDGSGMIQDKLEPIGTLKTRIAQIKQVKAGDTVGYSRRGITNSDIKIAVLAIGYADGYDRRFGNGIGEVFISGQRAKIIGNICMDMCMADISHIDNVQEGDSCEVYGKEISIIKQAQKIGTISYELLTKISARVKRLYYLD